jgi:hypothetical protein
LNFLIKILSHVHIDCGKEVPKTCNLMKWKMKGYPNLWKPYVRNSDYS